MTFYRTVNENGLPGISNAEREYLLREGTSEDRRRATAGGKSELRRAGCRVTPGRREATESATESRPPMAARAAQARVKRCGKSAPGPW